MKTIATLACVCLLAVGCSKNPAAPDAAPGTNPLASQAGTGTSAITASSLGASAVIRQTTDVLSSSDGTTVFGSATLLRNSSGITVNVATTGLDPREVYTLWWIIEQPTGEELITNASGAVIDAHGRAHFGGYLSVGPLPTDPDVTLEGGTFNAPLTSTVILVIHHHGPKIPMLLGKMLATFSTGCVGGCTDDPQVAVFLP